MPEWPYERSLCFPEELKEELRRPLGTLYRGDVDSSSRQAVEAVKLKRVETVVTVGDVTTSRFMHHGLKPKLAIVDRRFERRAFLEQIDFTGYEVREVRNPAGCIEPGAAREIYRALEGLSYVVLLVDGEEDLLALPAVLACPEGGAVAYGQPKLGCVVVAVDKEVKSRVFEILSRAEVT